ncbi:hypothetical protein AAE478_001610 [Parahypoxylon ruwenzoriense]
MPQSPQVLIYAELLSNIRQVSVGCSLHTPSTPNTKAIVSSDGQVLILSHDGVETSLRLPGRVAASQPLRAHNLGARSLSWRLPLAANLGHHDHALRVVEEQIVPWSAGDLRAESPITCRICHTIIVEAGLLKVWKDLPSENWAEMMEFWHCHKPHDHGHGHDEGLTSKGYGASSKISAQPTVGFVDLTSFLLSESDISASAITKSLSPSGSFNEVGSNKETLKDGEFHNLGGENIPIFCKSCKTLLGVLNDQASVSLFKWQVHVKEEQIPQDQGISPILSHCVSAMLLATIARSGCSRSIIMPMKLQAQPGQNTAQTESLLNIWVFNKGIAFSSTEEDRSPMQAIKVLYRMVSPSEADKLLDSMTSDVQDITLPSSAIKEILELLSRSNRLLSETDRQFKEWTVGLLEKWDGKDHRKGI